MGNKKKKQVKGVGKEEGEEEKGADEMMRMELELANERAKNDELDRHYFDNLPPGYRFHPTPKELIIHYLNRKVLKLPMPLNRIRDVDLYKFHPRQLSDMYNMHRENKLYFFTPRTRKYPNGSRPGRAAGKGTWKGFWKATGADKKIENKGIVVGFKKTLVFHEGKAKDKSGKKTNWIMHEYTLVAPKNGDNAASAAAAGSSHVSAAGVLSNASTASTDHNSSPKRLDDWVLCAIYLKPEKKASKKQDATAEPNHDSVGESAESNSIDHDIDENYFLNPEPVNYWRSSSVPPVNISQQVSDSTTIVLHEGQGGRNMEDIQHAFDPIPGNWDSSSRIMMNNVPAVMHNQQQYFLDPSLAQGRDVIVRNMGIHAPRNNQQVSDSTHHDLVQEQGLVMMSMENNNIPALNYEQDSKWNPEPPYLMNYHESSTRFLPAAANHAPPFMYSIHDQYNTGSQDFPAHNSGVVVTSSSLDCEEPYDPCNEYLEIANFPPPLEYATDYHGERLQNDHRVNVAAEQK